jgi:hypothetical protein
VQWHAASLRSGLERLCLAYQHTYGEADFQETQQMYDALKNRAKAYSAARFFKQTFGFVPK